MAVRAKIQIKNDVQDVGLRSIATAILIENNIKKALVKNDEKDNTIVYIILDENEGTLNNIIEALNTGLRNRREYPQLPEHFTVSNWERIDSNPEALPDLSPYVSDALQMRQMCKFVGVGDHMAKNMEGMSKEVKSMRGSMDAMTKNIATMTSTVTDLPKNITAAIKKK